MNTLEAIEKRRAVKHYDSKHKMTEEEIEKLIGYAMLSPSGLNIQQWRFLVVTDDNVKKDIRQASWDQSQVTDSSITIVLCVDVKAWSKSPERYFKDAPKEVADMCVPMIANFFEGNEYLQNKEALLSAGICSQTIMLAAKAMGYDSCPMTGFEPEKVAKIINLPEDYVIAMLITVGKPIKPAWPKSGQLEMSDVLTMNTF